MTYDAGRSDNAENETPHPVDVRGKTHGPYFITANYAQHLKGIMHGHSSWHNLCNFQKESLDLIATKISRILCGDASEPDHWRDVEGYARLVADLLEEQNGEK